MNRHHLFLLRELVRRDFKSRYAGSAFGFLWSFAQPLFNLALFTYVFATVMHIRPGVGELTENFAIFLFCGLLPWLAFSEGVTRSANAIIENAQLVKKVSFPSELLVLSVVISAVVHEMIAATVFVIVLVATGNFSPLGLPVLLIAVPLQLGFTIGLGMLLAAVNVFFRDTAQILGMVFAGWFYFTPIVYPMSLVPKDLVPWLELNPMTTLVQLYREALLGGGFGTTPGCWRLAVLSVLLLVAGLLLFRRLKPAFADEI